MNVKNVFFMLTPKPPMVRESDDGFMTCSPHPDRHSIRHLHLYCATKYVDRHSTGIVAAFVPERAANVRVSRFDNISGSLRRKQERNQERNQEPADENSVSSRTLDFHIYRSRMGRAATHG